MRVEPKDWEPIIKQWMREAGLKELKNYPLEVRIKRGHRSGGEFMCCLTRGIIIIKLQPAYDIKEAKRIFYHEFCHYLQHIKGKKMSQLEADKFAYGLTGERGPYLRRQEAKRAAWIENKKEALKMAKELGIEIKIVGSCPRGVLLEARLGEKAHRAVGWGRMASFLRSIKSGGEWWEGGWGF